MNKARNISCILIIFLILIVPFFNAELNQKIVEAKSILKRGLNNWNPKLLKDARDLFLNILLGEKDENVYILYYIALCDYRLTTYYVATEKKEEVEIYSKEGQKYIEKAIESDPSFGELYALYASLFGVEIILHPEKAIVIGLKIPEYFASAFQKDPNNPRINLLKGISVFYTPEAYGGGAKKAIEFFNKSINSFEKEHIEDPIKPSWGKEEAYLYLGLAYKQIKEYDKAKAHMKKSLEINPDYGYAAIELSKIKKDVENK